MKFPFFRKNKKEDTKTIDIIFDPHKWIENNKKIKLTKGDLVILELELTYAINNNLVEKDTILYYLLNRKNYILTRRNKNELILSLETKKETVIRLLKKDFKDNNGISFEEFISIYNDIIKKEPEKLI